MQTWQLHCGDALSVLQTLLEASVDCVVTSPPYYGLRTYGMSGELGSEPTPAIYVANLMRIFAEVWRVLRPTGVCWLNIADSYWSGRGESAPTCPDAKQPARRFGKRPTDSKPPAGTGIKPKDLIGIPWTVAFALRDAGWWLRSDTIWHKPNPMPGSALDRPTSAHEYCFLLSRSRRYFFNADAIREPISASMLEQMQKAYTNEARKDYASQGVQNPSEVKRRILKNRTDKQRGHERRHAGFNDRWDAMSKEEQMAKGSLPRDVWSISPTTNTGAIEHYAMMPEPLARKMVLSACPTDGVVCDPFCGSGTTGIAALKEGFSFVGVELSPKYAAIARTRLNNVAPLLAQEVSA